MASHSRRVRNAFEMLHAQSVQDATAVEDEAVAVAAKATAGLRGSSGTGSTLLPPRDDADERRRRLSVAVRRYIVVGAADVQRVAQPGWKDE